MVSLKFSVCLISFLANGYFVIAKFDPASDSNLVAIVNKSNEIDGKYEINSIKPIGKGGFGFILPGKISKTQVDVAIKMEPISKSKQAIKMAEGLHMGEFSVYEAIGLRNTEAEKWNVPTIYYFGNMLNNTYYVVVMTRLDVDIYTEFERRRRSFGTDTILLIILNIIRALKFLHSKGVLHRDVKPENLMTKGAQSFLIDYNLAILKKNVDNRRIGSWDFMSPTAHLSLPQKEIDDLISLGYVFMELSGIKLSWDKISVDKHLEIYNSKMDWDAILAACKSAKNAKLADALFIYMMEVKSKFTYRKQPDHDYLYKMLSKVLCAKDECFNTGHYFQWLNNEQRENAKRKGPLPPIKSITVPTSVSASNSSFVPNNRGEPDKRFSNVVKRGRVLSKPNPKSNVVPDNQSNSVKPIKKASKLTGK